MAFEVSKHMSQNWTTETSHSAPTDMDIRCVCLRDFVLEQAFALSRMLPPPPPSSSLHVEDGNGMDDSFNFKKKGGD